MIKVVVYIYDKSSWSHWMFQFLLLHFFFDCDVPFLSLLQSLEDESERELNRESALYYLAITYHNNSKIQDSLRVHLQVLKLREGWATQNGISMKLFWMMNHFIRYMNPLSFNLTYRLINRYHELIDNINYVVCILNESMCTSNLLWWKSHWRWWRVEFISNS